MWQQARPNKIVLLSTAAAALGGLLFGFDTAVIAGTTRALTAYFHLSAAQLGFTVSSALWGTLIGAFFASFPENRLGGRESLRLTGLLFIISALGCALTHNWYAFLFFRLIAGLATGGCSVFAPMYIAEVSPSAARGKLVGCFQLSIVGGILAAYASNFVLGRLSFGLNEWRFDLGVAAIPSLLFFCAVTFIPRSPRWLILKGRFAEAQQSLAAIGCDNPSGEARRIGASQSLNGPSSTVSTFAPAFRRPLLIALALGFFNQLSGINAILYYLNDIFAQAGFSSVSAQRQAVAVGIGNFTFTLIGMALIDRVGRKPLLLVGSLGMAVALAGISAIFFRSHHHELLLPLLVIFIGSFASSQGAVVWVYLSEIFPDAVRGSGQAFASFWLWLLNAGVAGLFPIVANASPGSVFLVFSACMVAQFVVVCRIFPETRGRSLETMTLLGAVDKTIEDVSSQNKVREQHDLQELGGI